MRSISRVAAVSFTTVMKLLEDVGRACIDFVDLIDAQAEAPKARGPYRPRAAKLEISN